MSDLYTKLVAGFIFPIHEHFKHHSTVSIRKQMEESQWWPRDRLEAFQLKDCSVFWTRPIRTFPIIVSSSPASEFAPLKSIH